MPNPAQFVWYELMTTDTDSAKAFYTQVVGWGTRDAGAPGMAYTVFQAGESGIGGMMQLSDAQCAEGARPSWIGYIHVDDVDAYADRVRQAGGKVHRAPADIPEIGRFAVVADPQGAGFILFKPLPTEAPPTPAYGAPGTAGWRELLAVDGEAAFKFYADMFGWTKAEAMDMGPMGVYQLFSAGAEPIGGMMTKPAQCPAPFWMYYFNVDGIADAMERIKSAGGKVTNGPHEVPGSMWIVQAQDPQGALFALVSARA